MTATDDERIAEVRRMWQSAPSSPIEEQFNVLLDALDAARATTGGYKRERHEVEVTLCDVLRIATDETREHTPVTLAEQVREKRSSTEFERQLEIALDAYHAKPKVTDAHMHEVYDRLQSRGPWPAPEPEQVRRALGAAADLGWTPPASDESEER